MLRVFSISLKFLGASKYFVIKVQPMYEIFDLNEWGLVLLVRGDVVWWTLEQFVPLEVMCRLRALVMNSIYMGASV